MLHKATQIKSNLLLVIRR